MDSILMFLLCVLKALLSFAMFVLVLAGAAVLFPCIGLFLFGEWALCEGRRLRGLR